MSDLLARSLKGFLIVQLEFQLAFVRTATVLKLSQEVLPRYHPQWSSLTPDQKVDIAKVSLNLSLPLQASNESLAHVCHFSLRVTTVRTKK